ncbi:MAG: PQQ-dependent dehydrogenase, methanol/ethanol family, partial [Gammaproteobacteria bacterium]|nr:PQQ-dependent dehydrogenase, methanol/ethanol family [Gammaproteobacteria bacterium]
AGGAPRPARAATSASADDWPMVGGDASVAYFSKLAQIDARNVDRVGLAWQYALPTTRGLEATPVVVDGRLYASGNWGKVYALDAASGRELWTYDPDVDGQWGRYACCDVVNRGVAVAGGIVYVASLDGYLHALDANTGRLLWKTDTLPARGAHAFHYTVTGAPVVAGNLIVIGNGGADFGGARGSISAYDRHTGRFRWRFYTVPRDPALGPQDQPHLQPAASTWGSHYDWRTGGGGAVWDGIAYDASLGLIYFGTANPAPYAIGPDARRGDELYAASIVAVHAESGRLAWYYQEVPGDGWDYDATQKMILARLSIGGRPRDVLMQAAKNGFFYVLDRRTGRLLSARPFTFVNWTRGIDPRSGRPRRDPQADYRRGPRLVFPGMAGAHSWQPMSYSPRTGLAYVPVIDAPMVYVGTAHRRAGLIEGSFEVAGVFTDDYDPAAMASLFGPLPPLSSLERAAGHSAEHRGVLRAIDPRTGRVVWSRRGTDPWDGGVLSSAGNLVIRGDAAGRLDFYAADSGRLLRRIDVGTSIMAAPATYRVQGRQYLVVLAGYGGGTLASPFPGGSAARRFGNAGRILAFSLDGAAVPLPAPVHPLPFPRPPPREGDAARVAAGEVLYDRYCARCHVFGRGVLPDLRRSVANLGPAFYSIVLQGAYRQLGMARWDDVLARGDAEAIHAYLIDQAWDEYASRMKGTSAAK